MQIGLVAYDNLIDYHSNYTSCDTSSRWTPPSGPHM